MTLVLHTNKITLTIRDRNVFMDHMQLSLEMRSVKQATKCLYNHKISAQKVE